jgi:hypothetical protein
MLPLCPRGELAAIPLLHRRQVVAPEGVHEDMADFVHEGGGIGGVEEVDDAGAAVGVEGGGASDGAAFGAVLMQDIGVGGIEGATVGDGAFDLGGMEGNIGIIASASRFVIIPICYPIEPF